MPTEAFWEEARDLNRENLDFLEYLEDFELNHLEKLIEKLVNYSHIDKLHPA